jgi:hypothetical protein
VTDSDPIAIGKRIGGVPVSETEHFFVCGHCGEAVDMRRLGDVLHYEEPDHEPLRMPS